MSPVLGVVPNGARIQVTGPSRGYPRGAGPTTQYWVRAAVARQNCTRVFIQYAGYGDQLKPALEPTPVVDALVMAGFQVPPTQALTRAAGMAEVRYFRSEDEAMARLAADEIGRALGGRRIAVRSMLDFEIKPASGVIEAWLDLRP
jgi:hypothetical protein